MASDIGWKKRRDKYIEKNYAGQDRHEVAKKLFGDSAGFSESEKFDKMFKSSDPASRTPDAVKDFIPRTSYGDSKTGGATATSMARPAPDATGASGQSFNKSTGTTTTGTSSGTGGAYTIGSSGPGDVTMPQRPTSSNTDPGGVVPGGGTGQPTPTYTPGGTLNPNTSVEARNKILYNLANPEQAMSNVLADMGIPLYDPVVRAGIMPAAGGLGTAFKLQQAMNPGVGSMSNAPMDFASFIQNALRGGSGGGLNSVLQNAFSTLSRPGFANTLRSAFDMQDRGQAVTNPYLGDLLNLLYDPNALMGAESSLLSPMIGDDLTKSLGALQGLGTQRALRNWQIPNDFMKVLLGV